MNSLFSFNIAVEITCFFIALFFLQGDKKAFWRIVIAFLLLTCCTELYGRYLGMVLRQPNGWLYNIYLLIEIGFIHLILLECTKPLFKNIRVVLHASLVIVGLAYLLEYLYLQTSGFYNSTYKIFSISAIILCLVFFYGFVRQEKYEDLKLYPPFWLIAGILFFYFGGTVINFMYKVLTVEITPNKTIRSYINHVLILLLYSFWSYSFICRHRIRKLQQSLH